jgi:DNA invertase Pin-like site-specific DNA recombinase
LTPFHSVHGLLAEPVAQRGAYRGRKKSLSPERIEELRRRAAAEEKKLHLARDFGISRETLYQYLKADVAA